jgi:hypothetical protein
MDLPVWLMYTFPRLIPCEVHTRDFKTQVVFDGPEQLPVFLFWNVNHLDMYLVRSLLILLDIACWYGSTAIPVGLLFFSSGFCLGCSDHLILLLLCPFF